MEKPVIIRFDKEAYEEYRLLQEAVAQGKTAKNKPTYEQLLSSVNNAIKNIKANPFYGDLIPRKYLSKGVAERYGTTKIFRVELTGYWRLLYTLVGDEVSIVALILEYMNHDKYDKIFGYAGIK
jgi:Txe/YoeB family toxin of Txe-Axe toxin-antitoxin module